MVFDRKYAYSNLVICSRIFVTENMISWAQLSYSNVLILCWESSFSLIDHDGKLVFVQTKSVCNTFENWLRLENKLKINCNFSN